MNFKEFIRTALITLGIDLTKNLEYDRLTRKILNKVIGPGSNCIDVGCHKGEIMDEILKRAPNGRHYAFEPIPEYFGNLKTKYNGRVKIFPYALADAQGKTTFQYVKNAPAYSGIKKRKYDIDNPVIEEIEVELKRLDDLIPEEIPVHFIKIDVEGAEMGVLKGALKILQKNKPVVIFEFGLGGSDYYNTEPVDIYNLLVNETGLSIFTLKGWLKNKAPLTLKQLENLYNGNEEYYYIALP